MTDTAVMKIAPAVDPAAPGEVRDDTLVERLRAGDQLAGDLLVERHCEALMRYLQRLTGSAQSAEDLHQQTWLSVFDHLDKFNPAASPGGFKAWVFRIATNKANDQWRSRTRERNAKEGLRLVTDETSPEASYRPEMSEQERKLRWAIEQLPEAQRQVVLMRYYTNLKFVEIADALGCPLNTALGRMHKAILKLRSLME